MSLRGPALSKRLAAAAGQVRAGVTVADIGCDHGKLCAFLLESGKTPFAYAADLRPLPLEKARSLFASLGLADRSVCVLSDGLAAIPAGGADDIVIAGLGYDVIARIIGEAPWLRDPAKRLILVPSSKHERLRRYFAAEGFATLCEQAVAEKGHVYTVLTAAYDGRSRALTERQAQLGAIDTATPDGAAYLAAVTRRMQRLLAAVSDEGSESRAEAVRFLTETGALPQL